MNNNRLIFDSYIRANPREASQLFIAGLFLVWQTPVALIGIILYFLLHKLLNIKWYYILGGGLLIAVSYLYLKASAAVYFDIKNYCNDVFVRNCQAWETILIGHYDQAVSYFYTSKDEALCGFSVLLAGLLALCELIPAHPHKGVVKALMKAKHLKPKVEMPADTLQKKLAALYEDDYEGTLLGVSTYTGHPVVIPDKDLNQIVLVLGTTGAGKTITLRRFYERAIKKGYPLIIVDGKPDDKNTAWLMALAKRYNREFMGFNCGNYCHYDCLSGGGYTELKDKIMSLKDEWQSEYYRSIAEDYLQTLFEVLLASNKPFDLQRVAECFDIEVLIQLARDMKDKRLLKRVARLENYDSKDITGLQAHLNNLIYSELGHYFTYSDTAIRLPDVIKQNAVAYFALPALKFPYFAKVLGKLVINDLKAVISANVHDKIIVTGFDELSVFASEQFLNIVNMGRGKGLYSVFGTQGTADLERVSTGFAEQILNCVNSIICHRLNDDVEKISKWMGTQDAFTVTAKLDPKDIDAGMGTVATTKEFIVHPDVIKQTLQVGEAIYVSKVNRFKQTKVVVKYS